MSLEKADSLLAKRHYYAEQEKMRIECLENIRAELDGVPMADSDKADIITRISALIVPVTPYEKI